MHAPAIALPAQARAIAPLWHTLLFLVGLTALAASTVWFHGLPRFGSSLVPSYFLVIAIEWLLVGFVAWGVRLSGSNVSSLIGKKWTKPSHFFRDFGLSLAFLVAARGALSVLGSALHATPNQNIRNILPHSVAENCVWVALALTAGICEELMTRGYLQKQLIGVLKSGPAAVVAQGVVFGAAHAYQGWRNVVVISVLGIMLGWLAQWRRSLLPAMMFHFIQDTMPLIGR